MLSKSEQKSNLTVDKKARYFKQDKEGVVIMCLFVFKLINKTGGFKIFLINRCRFAILHIEKGKP